MNKIWKCIFNVFLVFSMILVPSTVEAGTKISGPYYTDSTGVGRTQCRYITVTAKDTWTSCKYVSGQPLKGTYLRRGDGLYYSTSGGNSGSLSVSVGFGCASVGLSVPLGKVSSLHFGTYLRASKTGYYKIKAKKQVRPKVMLIQYRNKKSNGTWGSWGKAKVYMKYYTVLKIKPELQLIRG